MIYSSDIISLAMLISSISYFIPVNATYEKLLQVQWLRNTYRCTSSSGYLYVSREKGILNSTLSNIFTELMDLVILHHKKQL
jgi:hypothetical protein